MFTDQCFTTTRVQGRLHFLSHYPSERTQKKNTYTDTRKCYQRRDENDDR